MDFRTNPVSLNKSARDENRETMILIALNKKRQETDRLIADFTAVKEKEYAEFEQSLQADHWDAVDQKISPSPLNFGDKEDKTSDLTNGEEKRIPNVINELGGGARAELPLHREQPRSTVSIPDEAGQEVGSLSRHRSDALGTVGFHEREEEFRGLFTPSYLPLLDTSPQNHKSGSHRAPLAVLTAADHRTTLLRDSATALSSSATFPTSVFSTSTSPQISRQFSASVPGKQMPHHGASSSRSDISISNLRSSLRDPRQPHSPKRVLFSIDNVVVSPSTSPIAQRKNSTAQAQPVELNNVPQSFEKIALGKTKKDSHGLTSWDAGLSSALRKVKLATPSAKGAAQLDLRGSRPQSPKERGTSILNEGEDDDFESVTYEDDLFIFDEDVRLRAPDDTEKGGNDFESEDEDGGNAKAITSSSPHAGSLPIEIKWPAKRDLGR